MSTTSPPMSGGPHASMVLRAPGGTGYPTSPCGAQAACFRACVTWPAPTGPFAQGGPGGTRLEPCP
eukprot:6970235-Pyramimonas_sp.AAC.1